MQQILVVNDYQVNIFSIQILLDSFMLLHMINNVIVLIDIMIDRLSLGLEI